MATDETTETQAEVTPLNILITDGTSGVGLSLIRQLVTAGHKVTALATTKNGANQVREAGGLPAFAQTNRAGEIRSAIKMAKTDVLINNVPQTLLETPFEAQYTTNLLTLAEAITEGMKGTDAKFLVHTSFAFLYGDTHGETVNESASPEAFGGDLVTHAKRAETAVSLSGIPACILRIGYAYGPYSTSMTKIVNKLRGGRALLTGSGKNFANWVYEDDLAQAYALAAQKQPANQTFNIVDDTPATPADFLKEVASAIGISDSGGMMDLLTRALVNNKTATELLKFSVKASNDKAKTELGWSPKYASRMEGIEQTLRTWRADMQVSS